MKKERKVIDPNAIVVFDGDVCATELEKMKSGTYSAVIINGDLHVKNEIFFVGDLYVNGNINAVNACIDISGSLYCKGDINSSHIIVGEDLEANSISADNITVEGDLIAVDIIDALEIRVDGMLLCYSIIDSTDIWVTEYLFCSGKINTNFSSINVAGELECYGGVNADTLNVLEKVTIRNSSDIQKMNIGY